MNMIYVVALGGSTTESGYPVYTEQYLNERLKEASSPLRAVVFNFGVGGWNSLQSLQNYFYLLRYLHPDFVVIHENVNDFEIDRQVFLQGVIYYPQISPLERTFIRNSRFYRLLKFAYLLSYNHVVDDYDDESGPTMQARISSYLNKNNPNPDAILYFLEDFTGGESQLLEIPPEFPLTETYETFIKYTRADNSTFVITTQYLNCSKLAGLYAGRAYNCGRENCESESRGINTLLRNISAKYNVALVDLDSEMEQYDYLMGVDGVHFTEEGIRVKGERIGEAIFDILDERYNLTA